MKVITQSENETRLEYLSRVLTEMMNITFAGEATIDYDETTCDGLCLADDIASEVESLKKLQQQNRELVARVARLEQALSEANRRTVNGFYDELLNESPQSSLAEIEAAAVEEFMQCLYREYGYEPEDFEEVKQVYIQNLRGGVNR